jgi:YidC/Oxa1 family membrane protein insertase
MDRRTLLALLLTAIVIVATPIIFPAPRRPIPDSLAIVDSTADSSRPAPTVTTLPPAGAISAAPRTPAPAPVVAPAVVETTTVVTNRAMYRFENGAATPASVLLRDYRSLRPGTGRDALVDLVPEGDRLFRLHVLRATDTLALDAAQFRADAQRREGSGIVQSFTSTGLATPVTITYRFPVDSFVVHVDGSIAGTTTPGRVFVTLPSRLPSAEANVEEDTRSLAMGYKRGNDDVQSHKFSDLDSLEIVADTGAIRWVTERNKYFAVAVMPASDSVFRAVSFRGGARSNGLATGASGTAMLPFDGQRFALRVYAGPQAWEALKVAAPDLENLNPYGGWIHGMVQPFTTIVMRMLLWMRHTFDVGYGWVLVIFGVLVRLLLWPLNQNAMRSSIKMQRIQPQLAELQKKHADNPERQRDAMLKLYQEHGMSPFTPVLGCLPMLLPMPILFALYFVFQNTIELRGVEFLWLPDLSLKDPYYITPIFMGVSMFVLSWIGMKGMPPSPQSKMMLYAMPVVFTVIFWNFASGLNLYYAVQNVAALPQQWLLAHERSTAKTAVAANERPSGKTKGG